MNKINSKSFQIFLLFTLLIDFLNGDKLKFSKLKFKFKISEYESVNFVVGKLEFIKSSLYDMENTYKLNYNINFNSSKHSISNQLFKLNTNTLEIRTSSIILTRNITNDIREHYFSVYLIEKFSSRIVSKCFVQINLVDPNLNRPPRFMLNQYQAQIYENNAPDTFILKLEAFDDDLNENSRLSYHLVNNNDSSSIYSSIPFQIKSDTGEIYAKRVLNRELKDLYILTVSAIDNGLNRLSTTTQVLIRVLSQTNNIQPELDSKIYNLTLMEDTDFIKKPVILKVNGTDKETNSSNLVYSLSGSLNDLNTFEIDSDGSIRLVSKLNYELKNLYKLNIIARDTALPTSAVYSQLNIHVQNRNPPKFSASFYEFILFDNAEIGSRVGMVFAYDRDPLNQITYSFDSSYNYDLPFVIESKNGTIYTIKKVSKYFKNSYEFYVNAIDSKLTTSSVRVKVQILDMNDHVPEFSKSVYKLNVSEDAAIGLPLLTLDVINRDSTLEFSIENLMDEMFTLIKQTNNRVFLTLETNLNFKKKSFYEFNVKVTDQEGLFSMAKIELNVLPNTKYSPRFTKDIYLFQVSENVPIGSLIGTVQAIASTSDGQIVYKLITGNLAQSDQYSDFRLDEQIGNLYVSSLIDREKYESLTLYITASYRDKPTRTDHAIIQVQILDSNDNAPQFSRPFYEANVYLNTELNSYLLRVEAMDKDFGLNSVIKYSIEQMDDKLLTPVKIDEQTGVVRLIRKTFQSKMNLSLLASDCGVPAQSTQSYLLLNFIYEINSPPYFDSNIIEFDLYENQPIGTKLGEIMARDPDQGSKADITYKLLNKNDLFELKPVGIFNRVYLANKFIAVYDSEIERFHNLTIRAYSGSLFTDCLIQVYLKSFNEILPSVPKSFRIVFNNYKNYFLTEQSARVPVRDFDIGDNLTFSLIDSVGKQFINLDSKTGEITLKSILNSNNQINTSFSISITDGEHEVRTTCELTVLMISDNLIAESVTLNIFNFDLDIFLNMYYENFTNTLLNIMPTLKKSNIHVFNLEKSETGINVSLAVSYDYEKDKFMPASILKQIIYSNQENLKKSLRINKLTIYEDISCSIEPCLNYQQCSTNVKFSGASSKYIQTENFQFRPISIRHDFTCSCPIGFTGTNVSLMCDLEINLCYSNPCGQNGICISLESSFVCICDPDFTGRTCEHNLKTTKCASNTKQISLFDYQDSERVCRGGSTCKNLILGGILCDKCEPKMKPNSDYDSSYYNQFCELRARHFPEKQSSYLVLPGLQNRLRFKLKISFATFKSNSYILYNGRVDQSLDFISLKVINDILVFSYSLGDELNEIKVQGLNVSDGKWRTVTIEYKIRNLTLSIDNDNLTDIDSCELASNSNECIRQTHVYNLPKKCLNQIENCFRYFDLNGPLIIGHSLIKKQDEDKLFYEGCISDVYLNEKLLDLQEDVLVDSNTQIGCLLKFNSNQNKLKEPLCAKRPCFNSGKCSVTSETSFNCSCPIDFKGKYCEYEKKSSSKLLENKTNCPAKWWGKEPGICGPCNCDESKNFSPDCDKTNGQCQCKSKFYKKINNLTKEEYCVPCDCYLEGSTSLQCEPYTGQCKCLPGSGITGRRCDQCVSPLAEMTLKGNECRQLITNECPKAYSFNIWWPRATFNTIANSTCPKGSIGMAYRTCSENGWLNNLDLSDCKSLKLIDSQLSKWSEELYSNKSQLNSYQALKLVEDLNSITLQAETDEEDENLALTANYLSTSSNSLYAWDLITIKNLTRSILQYEIENAPTFLYIQDKYFLKHIFSILNRLFSKKYELKLNQFNYKYKKNELFTDLLVSLDKYLKSIIKYYSFSDELWLGLANFQFYLKTIQGQSYSDLIENSIRFKLLMNEVSSRKISFAALNSASTNLPRSLQSDGKKNPNIINMLKYRVVSNVFLINSDLVFDNSSQSNLIIDFLLTNNYDTIYDSKTNLINYRNLKTARSDLYCVYLNQELNVWSVKDAKLISYDPSTNMVKCTFEKHFGGIYAVLARADAYVKNSSTPIYFSIVFYVFMSFTLFALFVTILILTVFKKIRTSLSIVYTNLCLNMLLMQFIFLAGVNANSSQIICKFISILQHYFNLSTYLWLFLISLHLYRMLTELRDINKIGSSSPVFYYVIGYVTPIIIVGLTLGIKQDIYTNYDSTINFLNYPLSKLDLSSLYCWLNISNFNEIIFVYILPIAIVVFLFLIVSVLSYKEIKRNTFKQTDLNLVYQSLIGAFLILPFNILITIFLLLFLNSSTYMIQIGSILNESNLYEHLYLVVSFLYSILVFLIFVLLSKHNRDHLRHVLGLILYKLNLRNKDEQSLDVSKSKLTNNTKLAYVNEPFGFNTLKKSNDDKKIEVINVNKVNSKFILDYHDFQTHTNSISTTTTSGTLENTDDFDSQNSDYLKQNYMFMQSSNPIASNYLSNLINTTNTDTTANESDFNYNYDFNRPTINNTASIQECDVVDVGQVLKTRNLNSQFNQQEINPEVQLSPSNLKSYNNIYKKDTKYYNVTDGTIKSQGKNQCQPMFWPSAIAECDSSFLEGSDVYTPSKLPFNNNTSSNNNNNNGNLVPDLVSGINKINNGDNTSPHNCSGSSSTSKSSLGMNGNENIVNVSNFKISTLSRNVNHQQQGTIISNTVHEEFV